VVLSAEGEFISLHEDPVDFCKTIKQVLQASLRIPMKTATESNLKRPPIPIQSGHIFSGPV
jgi:hypothetical protein